MIQCPKCKHEIDDKACRPRICEQCGADLQTAQAAPSGELQAETESRRDRGPGDDHQDELASGICINLKLAINVNQFYMAGFKGVLDLKLDNIGLDDLDSIQVEVSSDLLPQTETWNCPLASAQTVFKKFQVRADVAGIELIRFQVLAQLGSQVKAFWAETDVPVFENTQDLRSLSVQADNIVGVGCVSQNAKSMGNAVRGQMDTLIRMDKIKNATDLMREYRKMAPSYRVIDLQDDPEHSQTASVTGAKPIGAPTGGNPTESADLAAGARKRRARFLWVTLLICMVLGVCWLRWGRSPAPESGGATPLHPNQAVTVSGKQPAGDSGTGEERSQRSIVSGQADPVVVEGQTGSGSDGPKTPKLTDDETEGQDSLKSSHPGQQENTGPTTPTVLRDLIVIVNCADAILLDQAEALLRAALNELGQSVEFVGDSQRASGSELRAKHAKVLAQHACPYMLVKIQAKDEIRDLAGASMPYGTVSLSLVLFDAGSRDPRKQVFAQKTRGSLNPAKASKDALDLAMDEAIEEMRHELE